MFVLIIGQHIAEDCCDMLTADGCRDRRARLWAALEETPDWILLSEPRHLMYFAGFYAHPFIFRTQNASALLVLGADGSSALVTDNMLRMYAEQAHVDERIAAEWYTGAASAPERQSVLVQAGLDAMRSRPGARFGVDQMVPAELCLHLARERTGFTSASVGRVALGLMRRKDPDEVAVLRRAIDAMEAAFQRAPREVRAGMTEMDVYALVCAIVNDRLGEQALVYGDFASGPRTEDKGGPPTMRRIEKGDLFLLDYSAVLYGYRADFTNTWVVDGEPTARQRELASFCLDAMEAGERLLTPGARGRDIDAALRRVFESHGVIDHFSHHSGHGLGLGHPDPPYFTPGSDDVVVEGDVVTLEPGLYVKGVGGMRFERNYLITSSGFELLTRQRLGLKPAHSPRSASTGSTGDAR
jgi:Xaa-Pro aminopeptidase